MKTQKLLNRIFFGFTILFILACILSAPATLQVLLNPIGSIFSVGGATLAFSPAAIVSERKLFEALKKKYTKQAVIPSPSYLRIEQALSNSSGNYLFDIKKNGNEIATERKLDRNDLFVVTRIGVYLLKQDTTKIGAAVLQTFPNVAAFGTLTGFTVAHLEAIYNGYLTLKTGQKVNIEALSMQNFRYISTSQQDTGSILSEWNVSEFTYTGAEDIYLHGTKSHEINITFPTFSGMQIQCTTASTVIKLVLHPYGFLLKNCADNIV